MKTKAVLLVTVLALAVGGGVYGYREYNRGVANTADETPTEQLTAERLVAEFATDEEASNAKYISKVIQVSGTVDRIEGNDIILSTGTPDNTVRCTFDAPPAVRTGSTVAIKGECAGAIVMIGAEVQMARCAIVE